MTLVQQFITIALAALGTVATRALPFIVFSETRPVPPMIDYMGKVLPLALFALLVVYCLKDVNVFSGTHGLPEFIAVGVTVALHLWRRNMLVSIAGGTICYMLLVQLVF